MTTPHPPTSTAPPRSGSETLPILCNDLPILYEDEGQEEMGESTPHTLADHILSFALEEHFRPYKNHRVFSNLNLYYHPIDRRAYCSPDVMVVQTAKPLPEHLVSYRIEEGCPAPFLVIEILSRRSFQQQDLTNKPILYANLGVSEYILVDGTGQYLPDRLLLKRRIDEQSWQDEQDRDGGVTSQYGFRILIEHDELPRVIDTFTGQRYPRPSEALQQIKREQQTRIKLEERIRELEAELRRQSGGGEQA